MRPLLREQRGFTLIELLVVIVIIAILAGIAIPYFIKQREKGWESQMQSALKNAAIAVESYSTAHGGDMSGLNSSTNPDYAAKLSAQGFDIPPYMTYLRVVATGTNYCIEAEHSMLLGTSEWQNATWQMNHGGPETTPDTCP
jgi:type IV pilus assembly protein PilA